MLLNEIISSLIIMSLNIIIIIFSIIKTLFNSVVQSRMLYHVNSVVLISIGDCYQEVNNIIIMILDQFLVKTRIDIIH